MKNLLLFLLLYLMSCGKDTPQNQFLEPIASEALNYDTIAIDSFSPGATSVDVAAEIRRASRLYQDSIQKAKDLKAQTELLEKAKKTEEAEKKSDAEKLKEQNRTKKAEEVVLRR